MLAWFLPKEGSKKFLSAGKLHFLVLGLYLLCYWNKQIVVQHCSGAQGLSAFTR